MRTGLELIDLKTWAQGKLTSAYKIASVNGGPPELADEDVPVYRAILAMVAELTRDRGALRTGCGLAEVHGADCPIRIVAQKPLAEQLAPPADPEK